MMGIRSRKVITHSIFLLICVACANQEQATITVDDYNFPSVHISNPGNPDIVLSSLSNKTGSIGFKKDNKILWLTGKPKIQTEDDKTSYIWSINETEEVILKVDVEEKDIDLSFSLSSGTKASPTKWFINIRSYDNEYFTGIFERVVDGNQNLSWKKGIQTALNLRGEHVEMKLKPTVSAYAPFYISSGNYGVFVHGTWPGEFDFCKDDSHAVQIAFEGPKLECTIYTGYPAEVVKKHARKTGPFFVPPKWAFGQWRWRDNHYNRDVYYDNTNVHAPYNSDLVEDVMMMEAFDIPFTAYWIDRPWGPGERGFDDYKFDTIKFPDPEDMIAWLNGKDIALMIWISPFLMGEMANYAEEHGYYLESNKWENARQVLMDFTNPEACKWWGENGPGKLARMGFKGFKLDRADGEKLIDSIQFTTWKGTSYRENYNDYPRQYVKATYDAVQPVWGNDFILFPRAQYTGSARYGAMWAGDIHGYHEGLRSAIIAMQRCAVMGYPVWGSDIGGYGREFRREACLRWLGFGCFSPIMETGPTEDNGFWNVATEPHYDTLLLATWRLYSHVRVNLTPYIHNLAKEASKTGMPIARPLFLEYPEQKEAWENWQTYMLGPDILVSAIWEKGVTKHTLYLPAGEKWIDAWDTHQVYDGGKYIEVAAPVHKIPVFIKKGADITLGDLNAIFQESFELVSKKPNLEKLEKAEGWR